MQNSQKAIYAAVSFSIKLKVVGWKETPVQVHSCEFCKIFKNDYFVEHVRTAASDILGYPYVEILSKMSTLKQCTVFSSILVFTHFKLILESCTISGVYLEPDQTSMMQKRSTQDIWQGSKYGSIASFLIFFYFLRLDTWMNIWAFCLLLNYSSLLLRRLPFMTSYLES